MSQADLLNQGPVLQPKGSALAVTVLELAHNDLTRLEWQLADKVAQAPSLFRDTSLVMALDKLPEGEGRPDLPALFEVCRYHGLCTLVVHTGREENIAVAQALGLPVLPPSGTHERSLDIKNSAPRKPAEEPGPSADEARPGLVEAEGKPIGPVSHPTKVVRIPVHGGMQICIAGGDLIMLAAVSPGVELLADENIHVYGPTRGHILADVKGDTTAQTFCRQLAVELISIASNYKVAGDLRHGPQRGKAAHVSLSDGVLNIIHL